MSGDDSGCTLASVARDFPEWHLGRPRFAVWAVALDDDVLHARLQRLRDALDGLLLPAMARQPHVTLHVSGFPSARPRRPDDFGHAALRAQAAALLGAAGGPFALRIGAPFTFRSAACLAVHDGGRLPPLRAACEAARPGFDATPYVPHVTAGLYAGCWPLAEVHARLARVQAPPLALPVTAIDWMCYDSRCIGGPLSTLLRVDLAAGRVQVPDVQALQQVFG